MPMRVQPRRRPLARLALAAVVAIVAALAVGASAQAFEIGAQDDQTLLYGNGYPREELLRQAQAIGVSMIRVNVIYGDWRRIGPERYDRLIALLRSYGMKVQLTLVGTPSYYDRSASRWLGNRNPSPGRFASFVKEVASRYRGQVDRYAMWNEPNLKFFLDPQRRAQSIYRNLYRAGYNAARSADPAAKVLFGELYSGNIRYPNGTFPMTFLNGVARGGLRADGFAYHPFQYNLAPTQRSRRYVGLSSLPTIRANLRSLARRRRLSTSSGRPLPIYLTEFGYQIGGSWTLRPESKRARWTVQAFNLAKRGGAASMLYYELVRTYSRRWDTGIIPNPGRPLPTYTALLKARPALVGR